MIPHPRLHLSRDTCAGLGLAVPPRTRIAAYLVQETRTRVMAHRKPPEELECRLCSARASDDGFNHLGARQRQGRGRWKLHRNVQ